MMETYEYQTRADVLRRKLRDRIAADGPRTREQIVETEGAAWDTTELCRDYEVLGFAAPLVVVNRRSDGQKGSLMFQHGPPRLYWGFEPHAK